MNPIKERSSERFNRVIFRKQNLREISFLPVDLGRPKLTMSSQSKDGPRNPVEDTTTNLWMS